MSTCKRMWTDREVRSMADKSAKIRIEAGLTENAKPIYCHPITIYTASNITLGGSEYSFLATALIFNNSNDEINTLEKLCAASISFHRLQVNGILFSVDASVPFEIVQLYVDTESVRPVGVKLTDGTRVDESSPTLDMYGATLFVVDGVNKLN